MLCLCFLEVCVLQVCVIGEETLDEVRKGEADPGCLCLHLGVACGPGWFVSVSVSISCNACEAVLCVFLVRYWNLLFLVCFRGWCQNVSVVSCSWRCVFASCDWREKMK